MIEVSEVVILLLGAGILAMMLVYRRNLVRLPSWKILLAAFVLRVASDTFSVVEGFFSPTGICNWLQHAAFAFSVVLLAAWTYRIFRTDRGVP